MFFLHRVTAPLHCALRLGIAAFAATLVTFTARPVLAETVTILTGSDPYYSSILLAVDNGYFKDEGLTVNHRMFPSGTDAMFAFRGIGAQFVASGDAPSLILWEGGDAVGVAPIYASPDNLFGVVRADLKTAADLKGKKIAVRKGSTADYFLSTFLTANGIRPSEVSIINLSPPECVPALTAGNIDGFFLWQPYPTLAEKVLGDKVRVLTTARGYYLEQIYLTANKKFAESNPETVIKVLRALQRAIDFIAAEPAKAAKIVAAKLKTTPDVVMPMIEKKPYSLKYGPANRDQLVKLVEFLRANEKLKSDIDVDVVVNPKYLRQFDSKLVTVGK